MAKSEQIMIWVKYQTLLGKTVSCIHVYSTYETEQILFA